MRKVLFFVLAVLAAAAVLVLVFRPVVISPPLVASGTCIHGTPPAGPTPADAVRPAIPGKHRVWNGEPIPLPPPPPGYGSEGVGPSVPGPGVPPPPDVPSTPGGGLVMPAS